MFLVSETNDWYVEKDKDCIGLNVRTDQIQRETKKKSTKDFLRTI